jgi:hypothetical protein
MTHAVSITPPWFSKEEPSFRKKLTPYFILPGQHGVL